jgi:hypothetical protein
MKCEPNTDGQHGFQCGYQLTLREVMMRLLRDRGRQLSAAASAAAAVSVVNAGGHQFSTACAVDVHNQSLD